MFESFLASTVAMTTPILLAALGELLVENSGVLNVGIEGAMLSGAFFGFAAAWFSGSIIIGMLGAVAAGVALNAILAILVVNLAVNQVVAGTALDIFALGLTGVAYRRIFGVTGQAVTVHALGPLALGPLARLPLIGRPLFDQNPLGYLAFALVPILGYGLRRTRYGLRIRAVGERPEAADALGLRVFRLRWTMILIAGALAGLGGAYLTLAYANTFVEGISNGRGFVALSVVIVGRWRAWGVAAASLLFGAAIAMQFTLQAAGTAIPYQCFLATPYLLTLLVLAVVGGQARAPGALGEPYRRP
ncbi:MAG TPA: ABC transporter permease [Candidatus Binataceae bacterium]|nr:ABC transporter permease [Candidatus Binataceae bacterium]